VRMGSSAASCSARPTNPAVAEPSWCGVGTDGRGAGWWTCRWPARVPTAVAPVLALTAPCTCATTPVAVGGLRAGLGADAVCPGFVPASSVFSDSPTGGGVGGKGDELTARWSPVAAPIVIPKPLPCTLPAMLTPRSPAPPFSGSFLRILASLPVAAWPLCVVFGYGGWVVVWRGQHNRAGMGGLAARSRPGPGSP
jgi:hypothetical protein